MNYTDIIKGALRRWFYPLLALLCLMLLGVGYYLQYVVGLDPCPLCILQRFAYLGVSAVCLVGWLHGTATRVYAGLALVAALAGAVVAARQVWLQQLPPEQVPECGPGLDFMLQAFPVFEALKLIFTGSGECADTTWTLLSLSIAEWSLFWFVILSALLVLRILKLV